VDSEALKIVNNCYECAFEVSHSWEKIIENCVSNLLPFDHMYSLYQTKQGSACVMDNVPYL
jgi:hypothetical protein